MTVRTAQPATQIGPSASYPITFLWNAANPNVNAMDGTTTSTTGLKGTDVAGPDGKYRKFDQTTGAMEFLAPLPADGDFCVVTIYCLPTASLANSKLWAMGTDGARLEINATTGGAYVDYFHTGVAKSATEFVDSVTFSGAAWVHIAAYSGGVLRQYYRKLSAAALTNYSYSETISYANATGPKIQFGDPNTLPAQGMYAFAILSSDPAHAACLSLANNPWQVFADIAVDSTAPILSSPAANATSPTTATASVSTDEAGGLLYTLFSTNGSEVASTIMASGQSQAVTATGLQTVSKTGLTANTTGLKAHFAHADSASTPNISNVVSSAAFSTPAVGDGTAPTLTLPTATKTGSTTATGTVTTDDATGVLRSYVSANASESQATMLASGAAQAVTATGIQNVTKSSLAPSSTVRIHYMHTDPSGNHSTVQSSATITLDAATTVTVTGPSQGGKHVFDGSVRASVAYHCTVHDKTTHALLETKTGLTSTSGGGVTFTSTILAAGTEYLFIPVADTDLHDLGVFFATPA